MDLFKKTSKLFKNDYTGVLAISFVWCILLFITISLGLRFGLGVLWYIFLVIPATISLKFVYLTYSMGKPITYASFKIGFITLISSIKLYFRMIKEALISALIIFLGGSLVISFIARLVNPNQIEQILSYEEGKIMPFDQVLKLIPWLKWAFLGLFIVIAIVYLCFKYLYSFLPYIAFQSPIDARSAKKMGSLMVKKSHFQYFLLRFSIFLFIIPIAALGFYSFKFFRGMDYSIFISTLIGCGIGLILFVPVLAYYGLLDAVYYDIKSIPFQNEINKALDKLLRELRTLEEENYKDRNQDNNDKKD